ncbi:hypothetical protein ACFL9T_18440 [Thermodesulfobacteriota bacterium]
MAEKKIPYQSKEWVQKVVEDTNASEKFRKSAKAMNDVHVYIVDDCPDGTDRISMYKFNKGEIVDWAWESRPHPFNDYQEIPFIKEATFVTTAPYYFYCKINKKEIGAFKALTSKEIKIQGSKTKMLRLIKPLQIWQDILGAVPTEYE